MIRATIIAIGVVAAVATAIAQQPASPQTTFRSGVDLVTIDVVATSANGAPVHNLTADDFELFEDGVPQAEHPP